MHKRKSGILYIFYGKLSFLITGFLEQNCDFNTNDRAKSKNKFRITSSFL